MVLDLDRFGYSAKAEVLDEEFGFTPYDVANKVISHIAMVPELSVD